MRSLIKVWWQMRSFLGIGGKEKAGKGKKWNDRRVLEQDKRRKKFQKPNIWKQRKQNEKEEGHEPENTFQVKSVSRLNHAVLKCQAGE